MSVAVFLSTASTRFALPCLRTEAVLRRFSNWISIAATLHTTTTMCRINGRSPEGDEWLPRDHAMLFTPGHFIRKETLTRLLENAQEPSANLIREVTEEACTRLPLLKKAGQANNIDQLIEAGAWCDAVLALIDIELPGWKLRRLICENGEWFCSLSRQPNLSVELDDTADASHEVMALANWAPSSKRATKAKPYAAQPSQSCQLFALQWIARSVAIILPSHRAMTTRIESYRISHHARACRGHPRLHGLATKTWMAGTSPAMTPDA